GLTYTYYDGSLDPLDFEIAFIEFIDGAEGEEEIFTGSYTAANKNKWTTPAYPTIIAQTIRLVDGQFTDISGISKEATSSRANLSGRHQTIRKSAFKRTQHESIKISKIFPRLY